MPRRTARRRRPPARKPRQPEYLGVADTAELLAMTRQGIYAAIKRGDLRASRADGRTVVARADAVAFEQERIEWERRRARFKAVRLSNEEFTRRLWESDPD